MNKQLHAFLVYLGVALFLVAITILALRYQKKDEFPRRIYQRQGIVCIDHLVKSREEAETNIREHGWQYGSCEDVL
jgi:hypothetical protein